MRIKILFTVALLLISTTALAQNYNFPNLTGQEVKKRIEQPMKILVVDARTEAEYKQGHIPTAINIAPPQFASIGKYLPQDKSIPIVFYCRGYS